MKELDALQQKIFTLELKLKEAEDRAERYFDYLAAAQDRIETLEALIDRLRDEQ